MSVLSALDKALAARLKADATLATLAPGGVWSGTAPMNTARPFVAFNGPTEEPFDSFGNYGQLATLQFDTFSPSTVRTYAQVNAVLDRIETLLRTPLTLDGHTSAMPRKEFRNSLIDDDNETRHGLVRYRFVAMET